MPGWQLSCRLMGSPFYPHHHIELSSNILPRLPNATTYRRHDHFSCFYALWAGVPAPITPETASLRCQCTGTLSQVLQPEREWAPLQLSHPWLSLTYACVITDSFTVLPKQGARPVLHPFPATGPGYLTIEKWQGQLSFTCTLRNGSLTPQSLSMPPTSPSSITRASCTALYEGPTLSNGSATACKGQG